MLLQVHTVVMYVVKIKVEDKISKHRTCVEIFPGLRKIVKVYLLLRNATRSLLL
jgi:hypothetical protein